MVERLVANEKVVGSNPICRSAAVAQLVERRDVAPVDVGSSPIGRPMEKHYILKCGCTYCKFPNGKSYIKVKIECQYHNKKFVRNLNKCRRK